MPGTLYVIATPIGNLEDITLRALRILREVDIIAAEDTRVTRKLLARYDIHTPTVSYHQRSKPGRVREILEMLDAGKNVGLVSDAGTPGISDPGHDLIALCVENGVRVESIPGPSAIVTALVLSGLPTARFAFDGFPPRKKGELAAFLRGLKRESRTTCLYESPLRLVKTLQAIHEVLGDRRVAVVREATKLFEEVFRGSAEAAIEHFSQEKPRGEIVIVLEGARGDEIAEDKPVVSLESRLAELISSGISERDAVKQCATEFDLPKRQVYAAALALKTYRGGRSSC